MLILATCRLADGLLCPTAFILRLAPDPHIKDFVYKNASGPQTLNVLAHWDQKDLVITYRDWPSDPPPTLLQCPLRELQSYPLVFQSAYKAYTPYRVGAKTYYLPEAHLGAFGTVAYTCLGKCVAHPRYLALASITADQALFTYNAPYKNAQVWRVDPTKLIPERLF